LNLTSFETGIKSHVIELILLGLLVFGSVYGVESLIAKRNAANDAMWQTRLTTVEAQNAVDIENIEKQNQQLLQVIQQSNQALVERQKQILSSPSPVIAQKLGGAAPNATTIELPLAKAQEITAQLEAIPVLQTNLASETTIATNDEKEVGELQTQLKVEESACKAQVADLKANGRKSKLKWFVSGFIAGYVLRVIY
jgi:hypothetical protein